MATVLSTLSQYRSLALSSTPAIVNSGTTALHGFTLLNKNLGTVYLKLFDNLSPTIGTTVPDAIIAVPPGDGVNPGILILPPDRIYRSFYTGLAIAAVTGIADSDTTAPAIDLYCEMLFN